MPIVDSEGRLFGKYNLIDVIIVLIVALAVVFAARQFLFPGEQEYVFVTLDLGEVDVWFAEAINVGDYAGSQGEETVLITDILQLDKGQSDKREVILRLKLAAGGAGDQWYYGDQKLTIGSKLEIDTIWASFSGTISDVDEEGEEIYTETIKKIVTIELSNLPNWKYKDMRVGAVERRPPGETSAEITDIKVIKVTPDGTADFLIKAEIEAELVGEELFYRREALLLGTSIRLKFERVELIGNITDIEEALESNRKVIVTPIQKIIEMSANEIPVSLAESIGMGDEEKDSEGNVIAEVIGVYSSFASETERNLIVRLKIKGELIKGEVYFKGNKINIGKVVTFNSESTLLNGNISNLYEIGATLPKLETSASKTIELKVSEVEPYIAEAIPLGVVERDPVDGRAVIEILSKDISPHIVATAGSDGTLLKHPILKDVYLEVRLLLTESTSGELFFKGKSVKIGDVIRIGTPKVDIAGNVVSFEED